MEVKPEYSITKRIENNIEFTYMQQMASRWTFEMPGVKKWVENWCKGKVLNLYAGKTRLDVDEIRIDISDEFNPDYCMSDIEFIEYAKDNNLRFDTAILDPPYNLRKSMEKYKDKHRSKFSKVKNEIMGILNSESRAITLGYSSNNMGMKRQFHLMAIALICHWGASHDTVATVEEKHPSLDEWF